MSHSQAPNKTQRRLQNIEYIISTKCHEQNHVWRGLHNLEYTRWSHLNCDNNNSNNSNNNKDW